jgi:hypothetical protein
VRYDKNIITSSKSMFVCSLFYLLKYSSVRQKGSNCRVSKSEHPNMILQKHANIFHVATILAAFSWCCWIISDIGWVVNMLSIYQPAINIPKRNQFSSIKTKTKRGAWCYSNTYIPLLEENIVFVTSSECFANGNQDLLAT